MSRIKGGFNIMKLCKIGIHHWGEWFESCLNKYVFEKEKEIIRHCKLCFKEERMGVDNLDLQLFRNSNSIISMNKEWEKLKKDTAKRNIRIYKEFQKGKVSKSDLARKYYVSRERIFAIIQQVDERIKNMDSNTIDKIKSVCYTGRRTLKT